MDLCRLLSRVFLVGLILALSIGVLATPAAWGQMPPGRCRPGYPEDCLPNQICRAGAGDKWGYCMTKCKDDSECPQYELCDSGLCRPANCTPEWINYCRRQPVAKCCINKAQPYCWTCDHTGCKPDSCYEHPEYATSCG